MFNGATNFYNLNNENFHDFLMEMYRKIDLLDKDTNYIRNHLIDELRKELRKIIANGELIVDIESVVDDFLINVLAETKVVRDIKKKLEECNSQLEHKAENKVVRDIKKKLEECNSQLDTKANEVDVKVLENRMNTFTSLPEGSTTGDAELEDIKNGADGIVYDTAGNAVRGQINNIKNRISSNEDEFRGLPIYKQINLADITNKQDNTYWKVDIPNTIPISGNAGGYTTIPRIKLKRGLTYYISNFFPNFTWISKENGNEFNNVSFIDLGLSEPYIYTATEDCYLYLTYTGVHDNIMVIENANKKPTFDLRFNEFKTIIENYKYEYDKYGNKINIITVKKDGTGDSTTIKGAIELCKNSSIDNQYEILIFDGEYNVIEELGGIQYLNNIMTMSGAYAGLLLPDYVHLKGMGKSKDDVKITANVGQYFGLDFSILDNAVTKLSPLNLEKSNNIENLTIVGQNCRYALHDESNNSYQNYTRKMKNVKVIHKGNDSKYTWKSSNGVGAGSGSGATYEYENCTFEGTLPYSIHDNTSFTKPNKFLFNNCKFLNINADKIACRFVTVSLENETITHDVEMNNCQFKGTLGQFEEAKGKGRKFYIHGGGNSVVPYVYTNTSSNAVAKPIALNEEVQIMINKDTETISKGSLVRISASGIYKLTTSDKHLFYGIALEDIKSDENGHVKTKGYVYVNDTNFASFNVGDKIGISDGSLVVTTGNEYIGVATDWNVMLLK